MLFAAVVPLALLLSCAFLVNMQGHWAWFAWAADSQGNDILCVEVWQYNGTNLNLVKNFTATAGSTRIHDSYYTDFVVQVLLNSSLAESPSEAASFTRVYMNLSYNAGADFVTGWGSGGTPATLNQTGTPAIMGSYYRIYFVGNWTSELPVAGRTYNATVEYQAYY